MPSVEGHAELVVVDEVAYLLPAIRPDTPPLLRRLLELRRAATIAGTHTYAASVLRGLRSEAGRVTEHQERWLALLRACPGIEVFLWRPSDLETIAGVLR